MYQKKILRDGSCCKKVSILLLLFFFFKARDKIKELIENGRMGEETFGLLGFSGLKFYFANAFMT